MPYNPHFHGQPHKFALVTHPIKVAMEPDSGKARTVVNLTATGVNTAMPSTHFELPQEHTPSGWFSHTRKSEDIVKVDAENAFYHIVIHPHARYLFAIRGPFSGSHFRFTALPMGATQSPRICQYFMKGVFARVTTAIHSLPVRPFKVPLFSRAAHRLEVYIDDSLTSCDSSISSRFLAHLQSVCDHLGITLAQHKIAVGTTVTVFGLQISRNPLQLTIPGKILAKYHHTASIMVAQSEVQTPILISDIETLLGYLEHVPMFAHTLTCIRATHTEARIGANLLNSIDEARMMVAPYYVRGNC